MTITLLQGDAREMLQTLPDRSVQCCVTSPPYYGLRKYTDDVREIGHEPTPAAFVAALVAVFREARRVLRDDGTLWVVIGDSYANDSKWGGRTGGKHAQALHGQTSIGRERRTTGLGEKNLIGIPWRLAFALQDDDWTLRQEIIWNKPNGMPENVTDRPTRSHETVFLFSKSKRYFYDSDAIAEKAIATKNRGGGKKAQHLVAGKGEYGDGFKDRWQPSETRNARSVWSIATQPLADEHYAPMPEELVRRCILAGSSAQACEVCGAPWARVVERESNWRERKAAGATAGNIGVSDTYQNGVHGKGMSHDLGSKTVRDLGMAPTCKCINTGSARSVVLDSFFGSGTVGRVAEKLQRDAIGIDLSYQELQEKRTDKVQVEMFV